MKVITFNHKWEGNSLTSTGLVLGEDPWTLEDHFGLIEGNSKAKCEAQAERTIRSLFDSPQNGLRKCVAFVDMRT